MILASIFHYNHVRFTVEWNGIRKGREGLYDSISIAHYIERTAETTFYNYKNMRVQAEGKPQTFQHF